ncbi:hypothetical protein [Arcobacter sp.]|uniref:hypothetical protein n=1 Tax=Arcobacter sp. TaxID=1872629 RepID=UPI003D0B9BD1
MNKFIISIIGMVIAGLIVAYLSPSEKKINISNNQHIQISNNQQAISNSTNGGSSSVIQNNNQSININYTNNK